MPAPDNLRRTSTNEDEQPPDIGLLRLQFEREKWEAELAERDRDFALREREQKNRDDDIQLKRNEQAASKWRNPLTVAIFAAAIAGLGNAGIAALNGYLQRDLESTKRDAERALEENKAESTRILEMIKTGNTETAAKNIEFLLETGLVAEGNRVTRLQAFLANRQPGSGPSLPAPARFGFEPGGALTQSVRTELQANLEKYIEYLDIIGFPALNRKITIRVDNDLHGNVYYKEPDEIWIGADVVTDVTAPLQQYGVSVLLSVQYPAKFNEDIVGLQFGLADYLTASFLRNPRVGEVIARVLKLPRPYLRTMQNERKFTESKPGQDHLDIAEIWGGLFWELRQRLTRETFDPILAKAWQSVKLPSNDTDVSAVFVSAILASIPEGQVPLRRKIQDVLKKRQFPTRG
jgi:hypothetical protein